MFPSVLAEYGVMKRYLLSRVHNSCWKRCIVRRIRRARCETQGQRRPLDWFVTGAPHLPILDAITQAFKFANRYGSPDSGLVSAIAANHGVGPDNVLLGAGSTEILEAAASAFLAGHKKVVGVDPTFGTVYEFATGLQAGAIVLPLLADHL